MRIIKEKSTPLWVVSLGDREKWSGNNKRDAERIARNILRGGAQEVCIERRHWQTWTLG